MAMKRKDVMGTMKGVRRLDVVSAMWPMRMGAMAPPTMDMMR